MSTPGAPQQPRRRQLTRFALAVSCGCLLACQGIGPSALGAGRAAYNDVIARTSVEEMLGLIVRLRYADPIGLLSVSSVTASLQFSATAGGQAGIGSQSGYAGNLVPFTAGLVYEDNPTISYVPIDGQAFLRDWLEPVSLGVVVRSMETAGHGDWLLTLLVSRMNGVRSGPDATPAQRAAFARIGVLLDELRDRDVASWASAPKRPDEFELILSRHAPAETARVAELLELLDLPDDPRAGRTIRIPVKQGRRSDDFHGLALRTRSIGEIMKAAAAAVEVPAELAEVALPGPPASDARGTLRIHSSREAPKQASVAVQHRDYWYYVDDMDLASKMLFQQIQMLFLSQLARAERGGPSTPMLTIPVK